MFHRVVLAISLQLRVILTPFDICVQLICKVAIPGGTGRSYGIRWRSGMRVTDETKVTDRQKNERTDGRTEG